MKKIKFLSIIIASLLIFSVFCGCVPSKNCSACKEKPFTVTFDLNGGTRVGGGELVQTVTRARDIKAPIVEREYYSFDGWDVVLKNIKKDTTVKAIWYSGYKLYFPTSYLDMSRKNSKGEQGLLVSISYPNGRLVKYSVDGEPFGENGVKAPLIFLGDSDYKFKHWILKYELDGVAKEYILTPQTVINDAFFIGLGFTEQEALELHGGEFELGVELELKSENKFPDSNQ